MTHSRPLALCFLLPSFLIPLAFTLSSCTRESGASAKSPDSVARAFVEAVHSGEKARFLPLLTDAARKGLESGSGFSLEDRKFTDVEFGSAKIEGDAAEVPLKVSEQGNVQDFALLMRNGVDGWRVFGVRVSAGEAGEMTIDFEELSSTVNALGDAMAAEFKTAFEEAARQRAEQERAERKERYDALRGVSAEEYESWWKNDKDFRGAPAGEALAKLAKELGLGFHAGEHTKSLSSTVRVDVRGVSRLEAIERITEQLDLRPRYPSTQQAMRQPRRGFGKAFREALTGSSGLRTAPGEEKPEEIDPNAITLEAGSRDLPVCFAGPYLIEVTDLEERVPHGTGSITVTARSFGYDPGVFLLMEDYGETVSFGKLVDHRGRSLKAREDVRYYGAGLLVGRIYESSTHLGLRRLLREVETIQSLSGAQRLVLPVAVEELEWKKLEKGARQQVGELSLEIRQVGSFTSFNILGPKATIENLTVAFRARDASGNEMEILSEDSMMWKLDAAQASVQTSSRPESLRMKLVTKRKVLEYPFEFRDVPLRRHGEQPEKIEPLVFDGFPAPVEVTFLRFEDRDTDFPKIRLRARNRSNKDALSVQATLSYLGNSGETLKDFPHTLTGRFDAGGHQPVALRHAEGEVEATAFFMPKETTGLRIAVNNVEFIDGSTWEPDE